MEIRLPDELVQRIEKYVKLGRFKDIEDFVKQAITLLLYAEDNKNQFISILKKEG